MLLNYGFCIKFIPIKKLHLQLIIVTFAVSKVTKKNEWKHKNC